MVKYTLKYRRQQLILILPTLIYRAAYQSITDTKVGLRTLFLTANFGVRTIDVIVEFYCDNLNDLTAIPMKDLDVGVANIHQLMTSLEANCRVRLNVSKCILLHVIRLHLYDRTRCSTPLEAIDIAP